MCHYCGATFDVPRSCPQCGDTELRDVGYGTERIEEAVAAVFPEARTVRMDLDTTRSRSAYERIIDDFQTGRANLLVGTQMVTKGLDFGRVGVVGILNMTVDKMIFPFLYEDRREGMEQLGIYSATSKVAMVMAMFTQAFRYAYEPFVFGKSRDKDSRQTYAQAMKYFFIFALLAFLTVMFYMDILRYLVARDYWEGLSVVAIVMLAEICKGIYMNLSFWYKLIDETRWGAYFSIIGCVVIVALNVWLVPRYGYLASAWASVAGYGVITLLSYFIGQRKYPIRYDVRGMAVYLLLAGVLYAASVGIGQAGLPVAVRLLLNTVLLLLFVVYLVKKDLPLKQLPYVGRFFK